MRVDKSRQSQIDKGGNLTCKLKMKDWRRLYERLTATITHIAYPLTVINSYHLLARPLVQAGLYVLSLKRMGGNVHFFIINNSHAFDYEAII